MNKKQIAHFMEQLDVKNIEILRDFGYEDPSDVLSIDIKLSKINIDLKQGSMVFKCDSIDFDAKHNKITFYKNDKPYLEQKIQDICNIKVRMVEN